MRGSLSTNLCTLRFKDSCVLEQRLGPQTLERNRDSLLEDEGTHENGARTGETLQEAQPKDGEPW